MSERDAFSPPGPEEHLGAAVTSSGLERGMLLVPTGRYISPEIAELEAVRLWPRVWQFACSVDHVAEPGDYFELRCGWLSVLIVRGDDGVLRAFQNACRHRGNSLCQGSGGGLDEIRCPFHRWSWDLAGRLREVPSRRAFGPLRNDDLPLIPVQVDTWGRLVFVNLDPRAESLQEWLEGIPEDTAWQALDDFRCDALVSAAMPANWKVVTEGFSETYHVQGIHPDMLGHLDEVNSPQRLWHHHGVSYQPYGVPSPRLGRQVPDQVVWDSWVRCLGTRIGLDPSQSYPVPEVPEGQTIRDVLAERVRAHAAARGVDLSAFDTERATGMAQYNLFPNATVLVWAEMINVLCARPGRTPDESELVSAVFHRYPPGSPRTRPYTGSRSADDDFGLVLGQDIAVIRTAQRGLHQPGLRELVIGAEECRVINLHRNLDEWLELDPATKASRWMKD